MNVKQLLEAIISGLSSKFIDMETEVRITVDMLALEEFPDETEYKHQAAYECDYTADGVFSISGIQNL